MRINISSGDHDINDILEAEEEYYNSIDEVGEDIEAAHEVVVLGAAGFLGRIGLSVAASVAGAFDAVLLGLGVAVNKQTNADSISEALDNLQHELEVAETTGNWGSPALKEALETLERIYPEQNKFSGKYDQPGLIDLVKEAIKNNSGTLTEEVIQNIDLTPKCFVAGTSILLPSGEYAPIEIIGEGCEVASFSAIDNRGRSELVAKPVVRTYTNVTQELYRLDFPDGRDSVFVTPGHAVLDEAGGFTQIGQLVRLGGGTARLVDQSGEVITINAKLIRFSAETADMFERSTIRSMTVGGNVAFEESVEDGWKTYNFEVEGFHTYVGGGLRVHNDSGVLGQFGDQLDNTFFDRFGVVGDAVGDVVNGVFHAAGQLVGGFVRAGQALADGFSTAGQKFQDGDFLGGLAEAAKGIGQAIGEVASGIGHAIGEVARGIGNAVRSVFGGNDDNDGQGSDRGKPIVLDMDGDGVEIEVSGSTSFDMDGDGFLERSDWVHSDDAFLVLDLNADGTRGVGDGKIDQTEELVLSKWLDWEGATDLQALATFDQSAERGGNNDGVLDQNDTVWSELRVWQDANSNGTVEDGELKTLDELGFSQINLTYDDGTDFGDLRNDINIFGSSLLGSASYVRNGEIVTGGVGDIALSFNSHGSVWNDATGLWEFEFSAESTTELSEWAGKASYALNISNPTAEHNWTTEQKQATATAYIQTHLPNSYGQGQLMEYLASYDDLMAAFGTDTNRALVHYQTYGQSEGRQISFDGLEYIASHVDLMNTFGANDVLGAKHFIEYGRGEGRATTFDSLEYIATHGDLGNVFGGARDAGAVHFIQTGRHEGRATSFDGLEYIASHDFLIETFGGVQNFEIMSDLGSLHYIIEGRHWGLQTTFDGLEYIASHGDLIQAFGINAEAATQHYIKSGYAEGRGVSFSGLEYIASRADLIATYGTNGDAGALHYIRWGHAADWKTTFDGLEYIASYTDLIETYGANADAGALHYIQWGHTAGWQATFDGLQYLASNVDLIKEYGLDRDAATKHYIETGHAEGRMTDGFDVEQYLANYEDVRQAFGSDHEAATMHYIQTGVYQGRHDQNLAENNTLVASQHGAKLSGEGGDDILISGSLSDELIGGSGSDTFVFNSAETSGQDSILDFEDGLDVLQIAGLIFADLTITSNGDDTDVAWDNGSVRLTGFAASELTEEDFVFV